MNRKCNGYLLGLMSGVLLCVIVYFVYNKYYKLPYEANQKDIDPIILTKIKYTDIIKTNEIKITQFNYVSNYYEIETNDLSNILDELNHFRTNSFSISNNNTDLYVSLFYREIKIEQELKAKNKQSIISLYYPLALSYQYNIYSDFYLNILAQYDRINLGIGYKF